MGLYRGRAAADREIGREGSAVVVAPFDLLLRLGVRSRSEEPSSDQGSDAQHAMKPRPALGQNHAPTPQVGVRFVSP